jgi:hypothetical protein
LEGNGVLSISDSKGNIVYTKQVQVEKGISLWNVSDLNLMPGVYFIQVVTENNQSKVIKHVKN